MVFWAIAKKDLRLLVRDARAVIILLVMPLVFILILGVSLGEGFGQKAADRLKISVLVLDEGIPRYFDKPAMLREGLAWLSLTPCQTEAVVGSTGAMALALDNRLNWFPPDSWAKEVLRDLGQTADIAVELIPDRAEAERLVRSGRRAAVMILGPSFSKRVARCSFLASGWRDGLLKSSAWPRPGEPISLALAGLFDESQTALPLYLYDGINPFFRDGVNLRALDVEMLRDRTQETAASIIDQVAQGSMLRVIMPWMIGRAFEKIGDPQFLSLLGREKQLPGAVKLFLTNPLVPMQQKLNLSTGLQNSLQNLFPKYNLTAKTWAALTKEREKSEGGSGSFLFQEEGSGWLRRGAIRYQVLVPSYLVMFAFFLVLTVGWLFVAERRQGTMQRLLVAPIARAQIVLGKLMPCLVISLFQGFFMLLAGKILFGMSWGPHPVWLIPVVVTTSLAAMGLALLVAALARTESQVAIYGTLLVLVLAGLSGSIMGDRSLMPERMQEITRFTPHAWALDAYRQLLANPGPVDLALVGTACLVLVGFGAAFVLAAWVLLQLEA